MPGVSRAGDPPASPGSCQSNVPGAPAEGLLTCRFHSGTGQASWLSSWPPTSGTSAKRAACDLGKRYCDPRGAGSLMLTANTRGAAQRLAGAGRSHLPRPCPNSRQPPPRTRTPRSRRRSPGLTQSEPAGSGPDDARQQHTLASSAGLRQRPAAQSVFGFRAN